MSTPASPTPAAKPTQSGTSSSASSPRANPGNAGKTPTPEAPKPSLLTFAPSCTFERGPDGLINVSWENGLAVKAVRGASIDYVAPKFHFKCMMKANVCEYSPTHDLAYLVEGGIGEALALVIVGMRKVVLSFEGATLNLAEISPVSNTDPVGVLTDATWRRLQENAPAFNLLLDLGITITGMNGLSLMLKGHNYVETDSMWARFESATDFETHASALGITDYSGVLFHDALHALEAEWKVGLVSAEKSTIIGHVNGVLVKRLPGIPAGTTLVFVTIAALKEIKLARAELSNTLTTIIKSLEHLARRIREAPLNWCSVFQRADTAANLSTVSKVEPLAAFVHGACTKIFERRMTILRSAAFRNNAARNAAMATLGAAWGESLKEVDVTGDILKDLFGNLAEDLDAESDSSDDEEEE